MTTFIRFSHGVFPHLLPPEPCGCVGISGTPTGHYLLKKLLPPSRGHAGRKASARPQIRDRELGPFRIRHGREGGAAAPEPDMQTAEVPPAFSHSLRRTDGVPRDIGIRIRQRNVKVAFLQVRFLVKWGFLIGRGRQVTGGPPTCTNQCNNAAYSLRHSRFGFPGSEAR